MTFKGGLMIQEEILKRIKSHIIDKNWLPTIKLIEFLSQGEYNQNFRIDSGNGTYVYRVNYGTQINEPRQIEYEFRVLKALEKTGVTPLAYFYDQDTPPCGNGVLLMQYLKGRPLDYPVDLDTAAAIFSKIHAAAVTQHLQVQSDPLKEIAAESYSLLNRYEMRDYKEEKKTLLNLHEEILNASEKNAGSLKDESLCIVNTEVNSHNFIIHPEQSYLVDWEKAVISCRFQDLAHFLSPTTTLWRTGYEYSAEEKRRFLESYRKQTGLPDSVSDLTLKTGVMMKAVILRALSWCYMAWYEYSRNMKPIRNHEVMDKLKMYLEQTECFLKSLI
jgi:predicted Ser/Thr protein kinase